LDDRGEGDALLDQFLDRACIGGSDITSGGVVELLEEGGDTIHIGTGADSTRRRKRRIGACPSLDLDVRRPGSNPAARRPPLRRDYVRRRKLVRVVLLGNRIETALE
jgi:hypothetical protein